MIMTDRSRVHWILRGNRTTPVEALEMYSCKKGHCVQWVHQMAGLRGRVTLYHQPKHEWVLGGRSHPRVPRLAR